MDYDKIQRFALLVMVLGGATVLGSGAQSEGWLIMFVALAIGGAATVPAVRD